MPWGDVPYSSLQHSDGQRVKSSCQRHSCALEGLNAAYQPYTLSTSQRSGHVDTDLYSQEHIPRNSCKPTVALTGY